MGGSQCGDAASHPTTACIGPQRYEKSGKSTLFGTISRPAARKSARRRSGRRGGTRPRCGQADGRRTGRRAADRTEGGGPDGGRRRAGCEPGRTHEPAGTRRRAADRTDGWMGGWVGRQPVQQPVQRPVQQPVQRPVQQPAQRPTCCSSHSRRASPRKSTATTRRSPSSSRLCGMVRMSNRRNRES